MSASLINHASYDLLGGSRKREKPTQLDQTLSRYNDERVSIRDTLQENSEELLYLWGDYLTVDTGCQAGMTPKRRLQSCQHCEELNHLFDLEVDKPFVLECGRYIGRTLIVRQPVIEPARLEFDRDLLEQGDRILKLSPLLGSCGFIQVDKYLTCDNLSAEVLMRVAFNEICISPTVFLTAFQCRSSRYLVESYSRSWVDPELELHKLTPGQCQDIFIHFIATLHCLSAHQTILGELDGRSILVKNEPPSVIYDKVHVKGPFGVSFAYTPGSSMTVGDTRICSTVTPKVVADVHPKIHIYELASGSGKVTTVYSLDAGTRTTFLRHRRSGIPLYPGSLELYIILIVLCCNKKFFDVITQTYRDLWWRLWLGKDDANIVTRKILQWQAANYNPLHDEIIDVLLGRWLRCDALELTWEVIQSFHNIDLVKESK